MSTEIDEAPVTVQDLPMMFKVIINESKIFSIELFKQLKYLFTSFTTCSFIHSYFLRLLFISFPLLTLYRSKIFNVFKSVYCGCNCVLNNNSPVFLKNKMKTGSQDGGIIFKCIQQKPRAGINNYRYNMIVTYRHRTFE